jgi:hypothetical protein
MRILHIIGGDNSEIEQVLITGLIGALNLPGIDQMVILRANDTLEAVLDKRAIPFFIEKFGGLFDLKTQKAIGEYAAAFNPHIVQSHDLCAAQAFAASGFTAPHFGAQTGRSVEDDKKIKALCVDTFTPPQSAETILTRYRTALSAV